MNRTIRSEFTANEYMHRTANNGAIVGRHALDYKPSLRTYRTARKSMLVRILQAIVNAF